MKTSARLLSARLLPLVLLACHKPATPAASPAEEPAAAAAEARPLSDAPLYDLALELTDQDGHRLPLDAFRGGPVLISMFYGTCPNACPLLIEDLKRIDGSLPAATRARLHVLLVSFDPERDSVERLHELIVRNRVDTARWRMARIPEDKVRELAAVLGIKYRNLADGSFNHSSVITLLDGEGRMVDRVEGLHQPAEALMRDAIAIARRGAR